MRHVECLDPVDLVIFPESQNLSIQRNITLFHPLPSRRLEWKPQLHHRCVLEPAVRGMSSTRCSIGYPVSKILSPTVRQTLPWMTESSMMGFSGQQSYRGLRSMRRSHQLPESIKEDTGSKCGERELRGNCGGGVLKIRSGGLDFTQETVGRSGGHWSFLSGFLTWWSSALGKGAGPGGQIWGLTPGGSHDS